MEGMRFTRNRQNTRSFGKFLAGNAAARAGRGWPCSLTPKCVRRCSSSQVTSDSFSRSETCRSVLFEIEIPCILLFLNRNKNSQNNPKRTRPKFQCSSKDNLIFMFANLVKLSSIAKKLYQEFVSSFSNNVLTRTT